MGKYVLTKSHSFYFFSTTNSLVKEVAYYEKEVLENEAQLEDMKAKNQDPYDIKKFQEVLDESYMMIPDSKGRLKQALEDLQSYTESSEVESLQSNEWFVQAKDLLTKELEVTDDALVETDVTDLQEGEAF